MMEKLRHDGNKLLERFNQETLSQDLASPIILQIDEWEKTIKGKVTQAAERARHQVTQSFDVRHTKISDKFEEFSTNFVKLRASDDFVETDLEQLKQRLRHLNEDLQELTAPATLELCLDESARIPWDKLLTLSEQPRPTHPQTGEGKYCAYISLIW